MKTLPYLLCIYRYIPKLSTTLSKSLYRSLAGRHFYGTKNVIWAGFGPVGNTEKRFGPSMSNFWGRFYVFIGKTMFIFL